MSNCSYLTCTYHQERSDEAFLIGLSINLKVDFYVDRILIGGMWFGLASANQCNIMPTNDNIQLHINCTIMKAKIAVGHVQSCRMSRI